MNSNIYDNVIPNIEDKLCLEEIKALLKKEEQSNKNKILLFNTLISINPTSLLSTYKEYYGNNSEFLFKDFKKLYFLIRNYNFNMYENDNVECFFMDSNELKDVLSGSNKGIKSVICKIKTKSPEIEIHEDLLVNFVR